ncbi:GGDEF domain-containing protein [Myxococcota bacterium]|nr:GGDEF domain-containing protein [Myxococcota bacterium]
MQQVEPSAREPGDARRSTAAAGAPAEDRGHAGVHARRIRDVLAICLVAWTLFGVQALVLAHPRTAAVQLGAAGGTAALLAMAWAGEPRRSRLAAHVHAGLCLVALVFASALSGGSQSTVLWFLAGLPALVSYQFGRRAALGWSLACLAGITGVLWLENLAVLPVEVLVTPAQRWSGAVVFATILFVLGLSAHHATRHLERDLARRNEALRQARDHIRQQERALREALAEAREQAIRDPLTGCFNRRWFDSALPMEVERARRDRGAVVLLLVDVDRFKRVNDKYGHPAGDEVLRTVARLLGETFRRTDMVCRLGGDEFAVILPTATPHAAPEAVSRFHRALAEAEVIGLPSGRRLATSMGYARFEAASEEALAPGEAVSEAKLLAEALLHQADAALYEAKRRGGGVAVSAEQAPDTAVDSLSPADGVRPAEGDGDGADEVVDSLR